MNRASLFVRFLAILVVALCPFLEPRQRPSDVRSVVYVVDRSASIDDQALERAQQYVKDAWDARGGAQLGLVAFDARAEMLAPLGTGHVPTIVRADEWENASDLAAALRLASFALPRVGHRPTVALTDARPTRGNALDEVRAAAALGIRVDVVPLATERADGEAMLASVKPRSLHVAEGQPVAIDVEVRAPPYTYVEWTRDGKRMPLAYVPHDAVGTTKLELLDRDPSPGTHVYEVKLSESAKFRRRHVAPADEDKKGDHDKHKRPTSAIAAVNVEGKPYAVVFSGSGVVPEALSLALKSSGLEARLMPTERAGDASAYSGADLVVLADVRVSEVANDDTALVRSAQETLVEYVKQGGGLLVTGGVFGLAPEYAGTPLARVLPVEIADKGRVEDPPVALAIMLDRSGSMSARVGAYSKLDLALEASIAAADMLRPSDEIAIASVDEITNWDVALGPASRLPELREKVRAVSPGGGGIFVYTALKDAYGALARNTMPVRHVILFSDTSDSEEQFEGCSYPPCDGKRTAEDLAREARRKGITTTVVGIGQAEDSDTAFLQRLASASSGRFYLTAEGTDLRRIFVSETKVLSQSNLRDTKTRVVRASSHDVLSGIDVERLPQLGGYTESNKRIGADTALALEGEGRPFLASWRYGLGRVAALTTDLSESWSGSFGASAPAAQLLRQTTRHLLRQETSHRADARVSIRDRNVELDIELPADAPDTAAPKALDVFAIDAEGKSKKLDVALESRGPGKFGASFRSDGVPVIIARARDARGAVMAETLGRQDVVSELANIGVDERFAEEVVRVGEGRLDPAPLATLERTLRPGKDLEPTWPWALVAAAALVVLDLSLRRTARSRARVLDASFAPARSAPSALPVAAE